ncbi:DUF4238 domain-containing protein [Plesiomonas shigelloides]|uniref:DUF4238 domain-containing protein n=1 Tax=Plesiomonas shigelloides TaxID=703 RepID=UPI0015B54C63|nr:DUF4238 domain-containing protein [Plesiomonas shigelloides]
MKLHTDVIGQHTVPRFLLDNFGVKKKGKRKQIFTFDKHNGCSFLQSTFDASTRKTFYNLTKNISLEPILAHYEGLAAPIFNKIIQSKSIAHLTNIDKFDLSVFVALQYSRSYASYIKVDKFLDSILSCLKQTGLIDRIHGSKNLDSDETTKKKIYLQSILEQESVIHTLMNKVFVLYESDGASDFCISDHPVVFEQMLSKPYTGSDDLAFDGNVIYFPISPDLLLVLMCPKVVSSLEMMSKIQCSDFIIESCYTIRLLAKALADKTPLKRTGSDVVKLNCLQVAFSERYIYSVNNDFDFVEKVIDIYPELKCSL